MAGKKFSALLIATAIFLSGSFSSRNCSSENYLSENYLSENFLSENILSGGILSENFGAAKAEASESDVVSVDLEESIYLALENNRAIKKSEELRDEAKWSLSEARRETGLTLQYEFNGRRVGGARKRGKDKDVEEFGEEFGEDYNDFSHSATISIPIYSGGKLENQQKAAKFALNSADLALENTKQEVKFKATQAYYQILLCRDMIGVNEEAVSTLEEYLKKANAQFELGRAARADILATTVQIANAKKNLRLAQSEYDKAIAALNNVIGFPVQTQLAIHDQLKYSKYNLDLDECLEYAVKNRPDSAAVGYEVKQAEAAVGIAKSDARPHLNAEANRTNAGDRVFSTNHERSWSAGITARWNIFDNGITDSKVKERKSELRRVEHEAEEINERVKLEVHSAFIDLQAEEDNIQIISAAVSQAEEEYALAQVRYVEGVGSNLAVLDSQEKLTSARTNYYTTLFNYSLAKAALDRAMGVPVDIDVPRYVATQK